MEEHRQRWYKRGLGPRVDALEVALRALLLRETAAEKNIRMIAESLRAASRSYGFAGVFEAARNVEEAPSADLPDRTRDLIKVLRHELADEPLLASTILLVGEQNTFMEALSRELESQGKETIFATTSAQAQQLLLERDMVFIVLDLFLPDQDGRYLLEILRSKPLTAAIPVIAIAAKVNAEIIGRQLVPEVDGCFAKPADPRKVAEFITSRLRRAHEVTRSARRDILTGLLNRAAFCEAFEHIMRFNETSKEPITLALLEVDGFHTLAQEHGAAVGELALQRVGQVLSASFRATDIVARWSPAQFAILFPGEDQFGGVRAIEKAMQALRRQHPATVGGQIFQVTMSAGLAVLARRATVEQAIEEADRFLYTAKSSGGNRVITTETTVERRLESVLVFAREDISNVLKQLLGNNGFDVMLANKTPEAVLGALTQSRCRLVLLEEENGGLSGFDLLRRIRENPRFNRIPVVMLVANEEHAARALGLGANDYLLKPFTPFAFISRMRYLLTRGMGSGERPRTLLLMDPDTAALIIVGTTLHKKAGFRVLLARHGLEGLGRLQREAEDGILLEPRLPEVQAPNLLHHLCEHHPGRARRGDRRR
ncbi:MAG: response regulator [Kiritimatiellaeota bacterium]|nr:response regulator [Kiritimatiellota bacterium]